MKKRLHILIIMLSLGFFLSPSLGYACGTKTEKECSKKEATFKTEKKECCKKTQSNEEDTSCGGKCGHSNCTTSTVNFSLISFNEIDFNNNNFNFSTEKPKFHHSETFISSGFTSVWLPPKI